ncbi:MAG: hypothetical protein RL722_1237 [Pseudomonadota bacterium]|jgi:hypothetical protein
MTLPHRRPALPPTIQTLGCAALALGLTLTLAITPGPAQAQIYKCTEGSAVTYQSQPCPIARERGGKEVTAAELNELRRKQLQAAAAAAASSPAAASAPQRGETAAPTTVQPAAQDRPQRSTGTILQTRREPSGATTASPFRCDSRRYCSQMTSCEEATYFLRNCPGVEMDGDLDGIPCENQWCNSSR